jgi:hypothetical protein
MPYNSRPYKVRQSGQFLIAGAMFPENEDKTMPWFLKAPEATG